MAKPPNYDVHLFVRDLRIEEIIVLIWLEVWKQQRSI